MRSRRGQFRWSPCSSRTGIVSWWVRTLGWTLLAGPPVGTERLVPPPWQSSFLKLRPRHCICETVLGFVGTFQLWALVIFRSPLSVGGCQGCAEAQTQILSVTYTPRLPLSAWGFRFGLLIGLTPRTPHSHWPIDVDQSVLLLAVLRQYLEK